jgi:hypothetical protein
MKRTTSMIYEQERLLLHCQEAVADAIERSGLKRRQIAEELGKNKSFVTQALSSGRNLTISSLAALMWSAGFRIEPHIVPVAQEDTGDMCPLHLVRRDSVYEDTATEDQVDEGPEPEDAFGAAS